MPMSQWFVRAQSRFSISKPKMEVLDYLQKITTARSFMDQEYWYPHGGKKWRRNYWKRFDLLYLPRGDQLMRSVRTRIRWKAGSGQKNQEPYKTSWRSWRKFCLVKREVIVYCKLEKAALCWAIDGNYFFNIMSPLYWNLRAVDVVTCSYSAKM